jgi:flagellin-like hook-associated protein FlgL
MDRTVDLSASQQLLSFTLDARRRITSLQTQAASGYTAQTYDGLGGDALRLVRLETLRDLSRRMVDNNDALDRRLKMTETTLGAVRDTVEGFRASLLEFSKGNLDDAVRVADVQDAAYKALESLEGLLNTDLDGRLLFSGSRVTTRPVELHLTSLAAFQATFDGAAVTVSTSAEGGLVPMTLTQTGTGNLVFATDGTITATTPGAFAALEEGTTIRMAGTTANDGDYTITGNDGTVLTVRQVGLVDGTATGLETPGGITVPVADAGSLTVTAPGTIVAGVTGSLAAIPVGSALRLNGSAGNGGPYTVASNDGTTLTIETHGLTLETVTAPGTTTLTTAPFAYYLGDEVAREHRLDGERSTSLDLTAAHPAFEKAIRALGLIAQGRYGSAGGLDQHPERVEQALYLLNSAIERVEAGTPPFGAEAVGNLDVIEMEIGYQRVLVDETNTHLKAGIGDADGDAADIEIADPTEVMTRLLNQANALEASFQAMARISKLSLVNFL